MKTVPLFAALVCLTCHSFAGIKKSNKETEEPKEKLSLNQVKPGSAADGTIIIDIVGRAQAGDLISFILPNKKTVIGKVTKVSIIEDRRIHVIGIFLNEEDAGFGFVFDKSGMVGGTLVFKKTKEIYRMRFNDMTNKFYFLQDVYKEDEDPKS